MGERRKTANPLTLPSVCNCAEPVTVARLAGPSLSTMSVAPGAIVCSKVGPDGAVEPDWGRLSGSVTGAPLSSKKLSFAVAALVQVLTSVNVVLYPPPEAKCAIEPPFAVPGLSALNTPAASAGMEVNECCGFTRIPSTLICPAVAVVN